MKKNLLLTLTEKPSVFDLKGKNMVKIIKKDYPWKIIVEDKISKNQNPYVSIGIGFTEKDNQAQSEDTQYKTKWTNLVRLEDLLKLSSSAENAYQQYNFKKRAGKAGKQAKSTSTGTATAKCLF